LGLANDPSDRRDVTDEVETKPVVKRRVDRVRRAHQEKCVAVRRCAHDRLGADVGASARPVVDDKLLAEPISSAVTSLLSLHRVSALVPWRPKLPPRRHAHDRPQRRLRPAGNDQIGPRTRQLRRDYEGATRIVHALIIDGKILTFVKAILSRYRAECLIRDGKNFRRPM
jgi:hypothetical protein